MEEGEKQEGLRCVHNTSNGAHRWMLGPPVWVPSVFALLQQVLAPPVVWMLIENPAAVLDVRRVNVTIAPVVQQVGQVLAQLEHLAAEVWTFVDANLVHTRKLEH